MEKPCIGERVVWQRTTTKALGRGEVIGYCAWSPNVIYVRRDDGAETVVNIRFLVRG